LGVASAIDSKRSLLIIFAMAKMFKIKQMAISNLFEYRHLLLFCVFDVAYCRIVAVGASF
jgi:hypothetical protein